MVVIVSSAYVIRYVCESRRERVREASYTTILREYAEQFKTGLTRKEAEEHLRARRIAFTHTCCPYKAGIVADLIRIGREKAGWPCREKWIYIGFDFHAAEPHDDPLKAYETDVLDEVKIFRQMVGCL